MNPRSRINRCFRVSTFTAAASAALALPLGCGTSEPTPSGTAGAAPVGGSAAGGGGGTGAAATGGANAGTASGSGGSSSGGGAGVGGSAGGGSAAGGMGGAAAGSGAGGGAGGASAKSCANGGYLVCEDFEATEVGQIPSGWTRLGPADKVGVAEDQAVSGKRSLKLGAMDSGQRRMANPGAALGAAHWGRIRFKVQTPVTDAFVHSTLVAGAGTGPSKGEVEVRLVDTVKAAKADTPGWCSDKQTTTNCFQLLYNVQPTSSGEFGKGGPYGWTFDDKWHCAEWHVDSTKQSYELFYDGARVDDVSFENGAGKYDNSEIPSAFSELRIGWNNYQSATNPGFTAWIDDVVLDEQRVGCE
jgi:hypothetical protein